MIEVCVDCRFFYSEVDTPETRKEDLGQCRRGPPSVAVESGSHLAWFTMVPGSWWCGEFRPNRPLISKETKIEELGLSLRARNCLHSHNTPTVGDLVKLSAERLSCVRGLGSTTLEEIREALAKHGLHLEGDNHDGE